MVLTPEGGGVPRDRNRERAIESETRTAKAKWLLLARLRRPAAQARISSPAETAPSSER